MKKTLSLMLVMLTLVMSIIAIIPSVEAEAAHSVVMTANEFIGYLQYVVDRGDSRYGSGNQLSVGKYDGQYIYFDCWGLGESIICTNGQIVYNRNKSLNPWNLWDTSCGCGSKTGDWLKSQSELSTDFTNIVPGEWLFKDDSNGNCYHVGYYIGNGKVIESTTDGTYNTQITTIDSQGRSNIRGSSWKWTSHGKVPWISYCDCKKLNDYTDDGKCKSCGSVFDFESTKEDVKGIYGTTKKISVSTTPYSATQDTSNTLKAGTSVEVIAKYKNAFGNTWYKVSYGNGKTGYLYETSIKEVAPIVLPSSVLASATVKTEVMSLPCSAKTNSTSYEVAILKKGESFDVTQMVENTAGNYWYKVKTAAGDEGWVWCEETKVKTFNKEPSSIIIGSDFPTSIPKAGKHVDYKVQTSYSNIRSVTGAIYNGTATSGSAVCSKTIDVNSKYINIYGSDIDNALTFGSLTAGKQYTLVITANLAYGYYDYDDGDFRAYTYSVSKHWTFTVQSSGTSCSHSYSSTYSSNADNHWKACTKCGATTSVAAHSYTNNCDTSCNTCGYTRSISHTYSNDCDASCNVCGTTRSVSHNYEYRYDRLEDKTSTKHWRECTICENKVDEESHTLVPVINSDGSHLAVAEGHYMGCHICDHAAKYPHVYDNDCDTLCNICNHKNSQRESNHSYSSSYLYDTNSHWRYCVNCNEKTSINTHNYSNSCDATCDTCNYTRTTSHSYSNACDTSCNICGTTRSASHTYSNACDTSCNVCGASRGAISHEYDNACDTSCNICGAIRTTAHKYSNACDKSCDVCGAERTVPGHVYDHDCDTSCNNCGYSRPTNHTYENSCDASCNVCGAIRTVSHSYGTSYIKDEDSHWRQCSLCGYNGYVENHIPGASATETSPQKCIVCEFVLQQAIGHIHSIGSVYYSDGYHHWYQCMDENCGARTNIEEHSFGQAVVTKEPTETENGEKTYTCVVCGEKKYEDIDVLVKNDDINTPNAENPDRDSNSDNKKVDGGTAKTILIVVLVVALTIAAGCTLLTLLKKPAPKNVAEEPKEKSDDTEKQDEENTEDNK